MDFAALLGAEINKAKEKDEKSTSSSQKYLKRSELEAQRQAAYLAEQKAREAARQEKLEKKRRLEEEEAQKAFEREEKRRRLAEKTRRQREEEEEAEERARRKRLGLPELPPKKKEEEQKEEEKIEDDVPDEELVGKLRELKEPAKLFGETHKQRLKRYWRLTGRGSQTPQPVLSDGPIPTTLELVDEKDMRIENTLPKEADKRKFLYRQLASYFTMVLKEWEIAMARRPAHVKESFQGKQAFNAMVQARENLKPFFKKMEQGAIEDGVLEPVIEIVNAAQDRRYVDANDAYLRLSIGKAAWPIGVTMVGIHERSAREKLHESDKTAHIMSDETTRKYLQSIKRCLSFAQTRWPPDDPLQLMG